MCPQVHVGASVTEPRDRPLRGTRVYEVMRVPRGDQCPPWQESSPPAGTVSKRPLELTLPYPDLGLQPRGRSAV